MKLLFDQSLSPRLVTLLGDVFDGSLHADANLPVDTTPLARTAASVASSSGLASPSKSLDHLGGLQQHWTQRNQ